MKSPSASRSFLRLAALSLSIPALISCGGNSSSSDGGAISGVGVSEIKTLSNRADLISGGEALVEVVLPQGVEISRLKVHLNGRDSSSSFALRGDGRIKGLVTGLANGSNTLTATVDGGSPVRLQITNYPTGGPIFSGPQIQPWVCETEASGLGPAIDVQCNVSAPKVDYFYKSTDASKLALLPYNVEKPPADVSQTTVENGATVPFIVRREVGAINRGLYAFAVLANPSSSTTPFNSPQGWNGALAYDLQGGALPQHRQGPVDNLVLDHYGNPPFMVIAASSELAKGYATVAATLNIFGQNTNSVVSAETVMMVKERISETLGEIRYTVARGSSGGSIQQNLIANAYPGLLDGINPNSTFPDVWSLNTEAQDCSLLVRYFDGKGSALWSDLTKQNAVMENSNDGPGTCRSWLGQNPVGEQYHLEEAWGNPESTSCFHTNLTLSDQRIALPWMYSASNTKGARCTLQDYQKSIFGLRSDGFANRAYDNVGVQYGLKALQGGLITVDQFIDLNLNVGGRDINWGWTAERSVADAQALNALYKSGQMNLMNNAATTPIIDDRSCDSSEIHSCYNSFKLKARLQENTGSTANYVLQTGKPYGDPSGFDTLATWVKKIKSDTSSDSLATKVVKNKPASAVDSCLIDGKTYTDLTICASVTPYFGNPRMGASSPISSAATKCQLVPIARQSYGVALTDSQWLQLQGIFAEGVCDFTKPGVGQSNAIPWLSFAKGPVGEPIGRAPTATREE